MYYGLLQEPRVKRRGLCSRVAVLALSLSSDWLALFITDWKHSVTEDPASKPDLVRCRVR